MSEHNGHGHDSHGDDGHDGNGHGGGAGVIPESSLQDKLLLLIACLCLVGLCWGGWGWAEKMPPKPAEHAEEAQHIDAASPSDSSGEAHGEAAGNAH